MHWRKKRLPFYASRSSTGLAVKAAVGIILIPSIVLSNPLEVSAPLNAFQKFSDKVPFERNVPKTPPSTKPKKITVKANTSQVTSNPERKYKKPKSALTDSSGIVLEKIAVRRMRITHYTAGYESTGKYPSDPTYGVTASGFKVFRGVVSADRSIPFGTIVYDERYGWGIVLDRGGAIRGNKLDFYEPSVRTAIKKGAYVSHVTFYKKPEGMTLGEAVRLVKLLRANKVKVVTR